jgi:hypothetical protein
MRSQAVVALPIGAGISISTAVRRPEVVGDRPAARQALVDIGMADVGEPSDLSTFIVFPSAASRAIEVRHWIGFLIYAYRERSTAQRMRPLQPELGGGTQYRKYCPVVLQTRLRRQPSSRRTGLIQRPWVLSAVVNSDIENRRCRATGGRERYQRSNRVRRRFVGCASWVRRASACASACCFSVAR